MRRERTGGKVERGWRERNLVITTLKTSTHEQKGFKQSPHECCASVTLQTLQTLTTETRCCPNRWNHLKAEKNEDVIFSIQPGSNRIWRKEFILLLHEDIKGTWVYAAIAWTYQRIPWRTFDIDGCFPHYDYSSHCCSSLCVCFALCLYFIRAFLSLFSMQSNVSVLEWQNLFLLHLWMN